MIDKDVKKDIDSASFELLCERKSFYENLIEDKLDTPELIKNCKEIVKYIEDKFLEKVNKDKGNEINLLKITIIDNIYLDLIYDNGEHRLYCELENLDHNYHFLDELDKYTLTDDKIAWCDYEINLTDLYKNSILLHQKKYYLSNNQYNYKIMDAKLYENSIMDLVFDNGERRFIDLAGLFDKIDKFEINVNKIIFNNCYELSSGYLFLNSSYYAKLSQLSIVPHIEVGYYFGNYTYIIKFKNGEIKSYSIIKMLRGLRNYDFPLDDEEKLIKRFSVNEFGIDDSETYVVIGYEEIYKYGDSLV